MSTVKQQWQVVDHELRTIATRRSALDADEARCLRSCYQLEVWKKLGMVSALDYLEHVLHYTPKLARERLRVARALGDLPVIEASFAGGVLAYSHVRELTRVATKHTDEEWCDAARGLSVHEVEKLVADRKHGDRPSDPRNHEARRYTIELDVSAEVFARYRETARQLSQDAGMRLDDDQLIGALCDAASAPRGGSTSPKYAIATIICEACERGWQDGGGKRVPINRSAIEKARCDAMHIGRIDGVAPPRRATSDVTPSVRRFVWLRDEGRCQADFGACRSTLGIAIHHLEHQEHGGSHEAENLTLRCFGHHDGHHEGKRDDRLEMLRSALRNRCWSPTKIEETLKRIQPRVGRTGFSDLLQEILAAE